MPALALPQSHSILREVSYLGIIWGGGLKGKSGYQGAAGPRPRKADQRLDGEVWLCRERAINGRKESRLGYLNFCWWIAEVTRNLVVVEREAPRKFEANQDSWHSDQTEIIISRVDRIGGGSLVSPTSRAQAFARAHHSLWEQSRDHLCSPSEGTRHHVYQFWRFPRELVYRIRQARTRVREVILGIRQVCMGVWYECKYVRTYIQTKSGQLLRDC